MVSAWPSSFKRRMMKAGRVRGRFSWAGRTGAAATPGRRRLRFGRNNRRACPTGSREAALLALDHVGQRLQRAVAAANTAVCSGCCRTARRPTAATSASHADNHFRRVQIDQLLQAVVAVNDAAVEVVQVAGGEMPDPTGPNGRRSGGITGITSNTIPLGPVVAVADRLDDLQPVDQILLLLLRVGLGQLDAQIGRELDQIKSDQQPYGPPRRPCRLPRWPADTGLARRGTPPRSAIAETSAACRRGW